LLNSNIKTDNFKKSRKGAKEQIFAALRLGVRKKSYIGVVLFDVFHLKNLIASVEVAH